ncbi:hypothetical protein [Azospirillum thermophilum]|uniref:hypothetical protein n=1 Tax=Azospirillum thermophilum TaxID=2202148 RepID=UPI0011B46D31|nr:hypothetical protein [Azospirillum thermophilum]
MATKPELPQLFDEVELARRIGVPAELLCMERQAGRLSYYAIGGGYWYTAEIVQAWLARVRECPEKIPAPTSSGSRSARNTTSPTPKKDVAASSPRVREIAAGLKQRSRNSSRPDQPQRTPLLVVSGGPQN